MPTATAEYHATDFHTRWMIRRDLPAVLRIEAATDGAWVELEFLEALRQRNCAGAVIEENWFNRPGPTVGFIIYELHPDRLAVLKLAADAVPTRDLIASALFVKLLDKRAHHRRRGLDCSALVRPEWRTGTVRALAAGRVRPHLPILADALEDAGCAERWLLDAFRADDRTARMVYDGIRKAIR